MLMNGLMSKYQCGKFIQAANVLFVKFMEGVGVASGPLGPCMGTKIIYDVRVLSRNLPYEQMALCDMVFTRAGLLLISDI